MAAGAPVIGTDVDGIRTIIRNGKNGYLVEENKRGKTKIIRKVSSRKVVPGSRFTINKK
jgi:glycosyltransferase involved in cell wall biosynthesis